MNSAFGYHFKNILGILEQQISRIFFSRERRKNIVDDFHRLYFDSAATGITWSDTRWLGRLVLKSPLDLWNYQEILFEQIPELILETGTFMGGSGLFLATICESLGTGRVISIDVERRADFPLHPRLEYWTGSSIDPKIVSRFTEAARSAHGVLVILDSDHSRGHVLAELRAYSALVPIGGSLIVEDTHLNGHPIHFMHGPGPMEAVRQFLAEDSRFEVDAKRCGKFLMTFNPGGYLRRVR